MSQIEQLRQTIKNLDPLPEEAPEYTWLRRRIAIRDHILNEDPDKFLEWSTIVATMNINPNRQNDHLDRWEQKTGLKVADMTSIVEFGAGYGAMIKMAHNRGFTGKYYSYDFPELIALQKFYLPEIDIKTDMPKECDLLIAVFSLSEADMETRQKFLDTVKFDHCLICYASMWDGIDNHKFFEHLGEKQQDPIGNHWYLLR